jgi:hypothetical protein
VSVEFRIVLVSEVVTAIFFLTPPFVGGDSPIFFSFFSHYYKPSSFRVGVIEINSSTSRRYKAFPGKYFQYPILIREKLNLDIVGYFQELGVSGLPSRLSKS